MTSRLARVISVWNRYWFGSGSAVDLAIFRILMMTYLVIAALTGMHAPEHAIVTTTEWTPVGIFHLMPGPIDRHTFNIIRQIWPYTAVIALIGWRTRLFLWITSISFIFNYAYLFNFGTVHHGGHIVTVALLILGFSRCGDALSIDARLKGAPWGPAPGWQYRWPIRLVQTYFCLIYPLAGFQKLFNSGFVWVFSDSLAIKLFLLQDLPPFGDFLLYHQEPWVLQTVAGLIVLGELASPLALLGGSYTVFFFGVWFFLHFGIHLVMSEHLGFLSHFAVTTAFVPWSAIDLRLARKFPFVRMRVHGRPFVPFGRVLQTARAACARLIRHFPVYFDDV